MPEFIGEHEVRLDEKGRFKLPAAFKRQLEPTENGRFVINRGFEGCLVLYPYSEWEKISKRLNRLNPFEKKNRQFIRLFRSGANEVVLDATDRILLPKNLQESAGITKDVVLAAVNNTIEIWDKARHESTFNIDSDDFADLAQDVMSDDFPIPDEE